MADFGSLSIKQLKHVLNAKCLELPDAAAASVRSQRDSIVEKGALIILCKEHVKEEELEGLLAKPVSDAPKKSDAAAVPAREVPTSKPAPQPQQGGQFSAAEYKQRVASQMGSPDQLKYQAACMRRDPAAFRRSNAEAANYSDEQVFTMAAQMEQMASDPAKLQAYKDQVSNMSDDDIMRMQRMQQQVPPSDKPTTVSAIDRFITALRGDPKDARAMLKSMPGMPVLSDDVYDKQLDQLRQMDPNTIKQLLLLSEKLKGYYDQLDKYIGGKGYAKYVIISVLIVFVMLFILVSWRLLGFVWNAAVGGAVSSATATSGEVIPEYTQQGSESPESEFDL